MKKSAKLNYAQLYFVIAFYYTIHLALFFPYHPQSEKPVSHQLKTTVLQNSDRVKLTLHTAIAFDRLEMT